jgi:hypothetical protein
VTTGLLLFAVLGVALACPLYGLWRMRRGRPCCGPSPTSDARALRARQLELGERVRDFRGDGGGQG